MKVLVTRNIPKAGIELLRENGHNVFVRNADTPIPYALLLELIPKYDALLSLLDDRVDRYLIEAGKNLKVISNYAVGYNNIDLEAAREHGIYVTNTPGVLTDAVADLTWALILGITRRILEGPEIIKRGEFKNWGAQLLLGTELKGKTLGVIGAGRIGQAVMKRALPFGMNLVYYSRTRKPEADAMGAKYTDLETLMKEADVITLHVPLTPETHHLLSKKYLSLMKPTSYLINTARGKVIDEKYLISMLKNKQIKGAALDVFYHEPKVPHELLTLPNVLITPHIGSATEETRTKMSLMAAQNILDVFEGKKPKYCVTM